MNCSPQCGQVMRIFPFPFGTRHMPLHLGQRKNLWVFFSSRLAFFSGLCPIRERNVSFSALLLPMFFDIMRKNAQSASAIATAPVAMRAVSSVMTDAATAMTRAMDQDANYGSKLLKLFRMLMADSRPHYLTDLALKLNCSRQTVMRKWPRKSCRTL